MGVQLEEVTEEPDCNPVSSRVEMSAGFGQRAHFCFGLGRSRGWGGNRSRSGRRPLGRTTGYEQAQQKEQRNNQRYECFRRVLHPVVLPLQKGRAALATRAARTIFAESGAVRGRYAIA
jgi:hypothetical protein